VLIEDIPKDSLALLNAAGYTDADLELLFPDEVQALINPLLNTRADLGEQIHIDDGFRPAVQIALDFSREQLETLDVGQVLRKVEDALNAMRFRGDDRMCCGNDIADQLAVVPQTTCVVLTNFPHTDLGPRLVPVMCTSPIN
jgi:hypothetical protein